MVFHNNYECVWDVGFVRFLCFVFLCFIANGQFAFAWGGNGITFSARGEQVAIGLDATGCALFPVWADLDQLFLLNKQIEHCHDRGWLGLQLTADFSQAQAAFLRFQ